MANGYIGQVHIGSNDYKIGSTLYAVCSDTGQTRAVIIEGFAISTGVTVHIKFEHEYTDTANAPSLKIKSSADDTAAASIEIINANGPKTWSDNSVIALTLTGTSTANYKWAINSSAIDGSSIQNLSLGQITSAGKITDKVSQAVVTNASAEITAIDLTVSSPSANGNSLTFIDTISQNSQGKITATKKTVQSASRTQAGVIQLPTGSTTIKFLREDGSWVEPAYIADTHYTANLIVGPANNSTTNGANTTTNSIYLNLIENSDIRNFHNIVGSGSVTVKCDANGKITITGNKSGTVTSITPGNGLINGTTGTSQDSITNSGTISIKEGGVTNDMLAGSIAITKLSASTIAIGTQTKSLGESFNLTTLVADLGLSSAMKYKGGVTSLPTATSSTTFNTYNAGDVVTITGTTNQGKEYVYNKGETAASSSWVELGDESSYKVKQTAVTSPSVPSSGPTSATAFIDTISQDVNGVITATKKDVNFPVTSVATLTGAITASNLKAQLSLNNVSNNTNLNSATGSKGDLIYWSDADTPARLSATGVTAGYVLTLDGGVPTWKVNKATDENVKQTPDSASTDSFPILFSNTKTTISSATTTTTKINNNIYIVPKTGELHATKLYGDGTNISNVTASSVAWGDITGIPTAANGTAGIVTTTSTVSSTSGLTASPIINGVVYYKNTNSTTHLYVNKTASPGTSPTNEAITSADSTYIHLYDDTTKRDTIQLIGAGGLSITATNGKVITLTSKEYESAGSANALTSLTLTYNNGSAQTNTVSNTANSAVAVGVVESGILYIKSIYYGTTSVSTGVQPKSASN